MKTGSFPFRALGKATIVGEIDGFAKFVADAESGLLLGTHIIGPHAGDLLAEPTLRPLVEATAAEIAMNVHAHPTLTEVLPEAALAVDGAADPRLEEGRARWPRPIPVRGHAELGLTRRRRARHVPRHAAGPRRRRADVAHAARRQDRLHHLRPGPRGRAGRDRLADAQGHRLDGAVLSVHRQRHDVRHERRGHHHRPPGQGRRRELRRAPDARPLRRRAVQHRRRSARRSGPRCSTRSASPWAPGCAATTSWP